jgi:hypothetical protein
MMNHIDGERVDGSADTAATALGEIMKSQNKANHPIKPRPAGPLDKAVKAAIAGEAPYVPSDRVEHLSRELAKKLAGAEAAGKPEDGLPED